MRKIFLIILLTMILIQGTYAVETLGTFKQGSCINLKQTCSNCTYTNITSVISPDSIQSLGQVAMTRVATEYNYTFCYTNQIGNYIVNGKSDVDGITTVWAYNFIITPSGYSGMLGFYIIILLISFGVMVLGFYIKDGWVTILGTIGLYLVGLLILIQGIDFVKDFRITWGLGLVIIGIAAYISINSAIEMIDL